MAIQNYIGWPANVNRIILDSTIPTVGENATQTDNLEGGGKRTSQKGGFVPDKFSVKMQFNWEDTVGDTGKTELQLFLEWYKYRHCYGSVPFEFPKILYSPVSGITRVEQRNLDGNGRVFPYRTEFYKITSAVEGSEHGNVVEVSMTWESVYGGVVNIDTPSQIIVGVKTGKTARNGSIYFYYIDILFEGLADNEATIPVSSNFKAFYKTDGEDWNETPIYGAAFDGNDTFRLYFLPDAIEEGNVYTVTFSYTPPGGNPVDTGEWQSEFRA